MSRREFAPSLLAPWTEAQAASPAAINPGTTASGSFPLMVTTWSEDTYYLVEPPKKKKKAWNHKSNYFQFS